MAIDTRDRRASCLNIYLGHGRVYPNPDGSISGQADRQHVSGYYPGILAITGMITTRDCRASCICLDLGFGRIYPNPDGSLASADDRRHVASKYCRIESTPTPGTAGSSAPGNRYLKPTRYRLYQAVAAPTWHPDLVADTVTSDRFESPWKTPVWERPSPIHTPGSFIDENNIPPDPTAQNERPWYVEFSRPVLPKFRAYHYPWFTLQLEPNQQAEDVSIDRFESRFSQPFFPISKRHRVHLFQYEAFTHEETQTAEDICVCSYEPSMGLRLNPRKQPIFFPIGVLQLEPNQQPEAIFVCAYESRWSQPIFLKLPVRRYLDGGVIVPQLFPMSVAQFNRVMLAGGLMWF